jgi:hypothetical protein
MKPKQAWAKMADQVVAFNRAAAGFNLGPLTQQIQQLSSTEQTLMEAAGKANDRVAQAQIAGTFNAGVTRIVDQFKRGAEVLSPLQTAINGVNDEYQGLFETLNSLNLGSLTVGLAESAAAQIKNLIAKFSDDLRTSLAQRLNAATGQTFLNDAASVLLQHAQDLAERHRPRQRSDRCWRRSPPPSTPRRRRSSTTPAWSGMPLPISQSSFPISPVSWSRPIRICRPPRSNCGTP